MNRDPEVDTPSTHPAARHRDDIDGLRALAILLVVTYHVWFGRVSGGVDVFLLISAYLLTASLVRQAQGGERLHLGRHWLRRFSRLLPAAVVTILGVLAMVYLVQPQSTWSEMWRQAWSSLFYVQNWTLALSEVDYYARDLETASPLQHFWSLSVQGQVFVLWPILIALTAWVTRRRPRLLVAGLIAVFTLVLAVSLTYSVSATAESQAFAYFDTRTRLWEFAAGSLAALLVPLVQLPGVVRAVLGWVGVLGIVACGFVLDVQGGFPGYLALWPVVCTILVILAGAGPSRGGPAALLTWRPLLALGRYAYALYLVHWPILIAWLMLPGRSGVGLAGGIGVIALSLLIARQLTLEVERPVRRFAAGSSTRWRHGVVVAACVALLAGPLALWQTQVNARAAAVDPTDRSIYPGAAVLDSPGLVGPSDAPMVPLPTELRQEWVQVGESCRGDWAPTDRRVAETCFHPKTPQEDGTTVLVVGDSHAQQLAQPLLTLSQEKGWDVVFVLKGGCPLGFGEPSNNLEGPEACEAWRHAAVDYAVDMQPAAVYVVTTKSVPHVAERPLTGVDLVIGDLLDAGIGVIGVRDNPRFSFSMYSCLRHQERDCAAPLEHVLAPVRPSLPMDDRVVQVDFTPWLCPGGTCLGKIGNIAVYIDDNHPSRTYGATLAPMLAEMIDAQQDRLDSLL